MAERYAWWKPFTTWKKNAFNDSSPQQDSGKEPQPVEKSTGSPDAKSSRLLSDETYDDTQYEPVFNENTCRRHLRVSRSGRFKVKRGARMTLPENTVYEANTLVAK